MPSPEAERRAVERTRELVHIAARRLRVPIEEQPGAGRLDASEVPASVREFVRLLGEPGSPLRRAWFPRDHVGLEVIDEGRHWAEQTAELACVDTSIFADAVFLLLSPDGTVVWLSSSDGPDPAVMYLTEVSDAPSAWTESFTGWIETMLPE